MRRSKIMLTALAAAAGLVIGFGSPKEVKAATEKDISGEWKASDLLKIEGMTGEEHLSSLQLIRAEKYSSFPTSTTILQRLRLSLILKALPLT